MLDLRLYRASLLPLLVVLALVAFSVGSLPGPSSSSLPPPAFDARHAFTTLEQLEARFPKRTPGSPADSALRELITRRLRADGYTVRATASTVIATQPGRGEGSLVLLADRAGAGPAALSGTAALLELARSLAGRGGLRALTFVSTDGDLAPPLHGPVAAAIVLGDLAGTDPRRPFEIPFSDDGSAASLRLQQTVAAMLPPGGAHPRLLDQLAQFAVPFDPSGQAPLLDGGIPAVLVQQSGEPGAAADEPVSAARLATFGHGVAASLAALQSLPRLPASTRDLTLSGDRLGGWAVRALVGALLFATALPALDVFARARRRKIPLVRSLAWVLLWTTPVGATLLFTKLLAKLGALGAVPRIPTILAPGTHGILILAATLAFLALACIARALAIRTARLDPTGAAITVACCASLLGIALWIANPYTAALLAIPLLLWLPLLTVEREHAPHPLATAGWLLLSLIPLAGVLAVEARSLDIGPLRFSWSWLLLLASGQLDVLGFLAIALTGGLFIATAILLLRPSARPDADAIELRTRGPLSYAGPGSLGGTSSGRSVGR